MTYTRNCRTTVIRLKTESLSSFNDHDTPDDGHTPVRAFCQIGRLLVAHQTDMIFT